jgi:hypothetical protein
VVTWGAVKGVRQGWETKRSETQFSGASFLSYVSSAFSAAPSSAAKLRLGHSQSILFFIAVTEHHRSASNQVLRETLVDASHRCRASIRTLNGPFWTRCKLGFDRKPRSITIVTNLGLLGAAIYRAVLNDQQSKRSHPNKAVGVVACQTFQITFGFDVINSCLLSWSCLLPHRSDSSSRIRWSVSGLGSPWPLGSRRWCHRCGHVLAQRLIYFSTRPKAVQQDGELSGHRYRGSLLRILPATLAESQSISS